MCYILTFYIISAFYYFPPPQIYLCMGEENHNLCCGFLQILPNLHFITSYFSHRGPVGSASPLVRTRAEPLNFWRKISRCFTPHSLVVSVRGEVLRVPILSFLTL